MKECDEDNSIFLVFLKKEATSCAEMLIAILQIMTASPGTRQHLDIPCCGNLQVTTERRDLASASKPLCCSFMKFFGTGCRSRVSSWKSVQWQSNYTLMA